MSLELWDLFEKTDTAFTKTSDEGARLTSINPQYQIKKFTEEFGPCGVDWGFDLIESFFVEGAPMMRSNITDADGKPINFGPCKVHTGRVKLWFRMEGDEAMNYITATGHTRFVYMTKNGPTTDEEYEKKTVTDGLTKAMSMLGMGGDVRMGQFEDKDYVTQLQLEEAIEGSVDKEATLVKQDQEYREWYEKTCELCKTAVSMHELEILFKSSIIRVQGQGTPSQPKEFTYMKDQRATELIRAEREQQEQTT